MSANPINGRPGASNRLPGIDGLRAVAALWVVFFHIHAFSQAYFAHLPGFDLFLRSGSTGVSLFLVLSGFCLYIPFAGGRTDRFKAVQFFQRRGRRLLPAYYVSLVLAVALNILGAVQLGYEHFTPLQLGWQILTHATLTHTLFPGTFYSLNGAYWSLGLEWQLYLGLPLLVLGIRRFGLRATVLAVITCSVLYLLGLQFALQRGLVAGDSLMATAVLPNQLPGRWAEFAFGMVAAELYATGQITKWAAKTKYAVLLLGLLVPLSIATSGLALSHLLYGLVFAVLLGVVLASGNLVSRFCSWRPLVALGTMSYSLYLVHQPIIQGLAYLLQSLGHLSPNTTFLVLVLLLPVVFLVAYLLYIAVEKRTLRPRPAAVVSAGAASAVKQMAES
jgi:peptidoglycan/LPS O-acetylase OafA/YrhL